MSVSVSGSSLIGHGKVDFTAWVLTLWSAGRFLYRCGAIGDNVWRGRAYIDLSSRWQAEFLCACRNTSGSSGRSGSCTNFGEALAAEETS